MHHLISVATTDRDYRLVFFVFAMRCHIDMEMELFLLNRCLVTTFDTLHMFMLIATLEIAG
jgi:hypothetical protein